MSETFGSRTVIQQSVTESEMDFLRSRLLHTLIVTMLLSASAAAKTSASLLRAHQRFHEVLRDARESELEDLLTDQFLWSHGDGTVQSKSELLEQIHNGKLLYVELKTDGELFREYRDAAVATGHCEVRLPDSPAPLECRYTLTFIRDSREWKVAAYQTTRFAPNAGLPLQVRLGYSPDAKLLIVNADDLAMSHSEDVASFAALDHGFVTSATVMVPCPWFTEVAAYAKAHPEIDLGLHLTLTSEWPTYRWGPVSPRALVPSLVGPDGYFFSNAKEFAEHAKLDEVETEIRAQIERSRSMGLEPSHLDAHMHSLYATPDLFRILLKIAHEYRLPIRMSRNLESFQSALALMGPRDPIPDAIFSPGADVPASDWKDYYVNLIKNLKPGVTEIFVHLAYDDVESQAIMVNHPDWGAAWRQRELDTISSPEFRKTIDENHIILIKWRDIQKVIGGPASTVSAAPPLQERNVSVSTAVDRATGTALQADSAAALRILMDLPSSAYAGEEAIFRACMVERFGPSTHLAIPPVSDPWIASVVETYVKYWAHSLSNPAERQQAKEELKNALARLISQPVHSEAQIDAAEEEVKNRAETRGFHALLGITAPLRDFMLWRTSTVEHREIHLPDAPFSVKVTFLEDFVLRGWGHYATCGRRSTGGWATDEGLFAVVPAYKNLTDETFSVRFLAHETQHFADKHAFGSLEGWELEYRAKLTELVLAESSQNSTLQRLCENRSPVNDSAHAYANLHVIRNVEERLGVVADSLCGPQGIRGQALRDAAREVLRRNTDMRRSHKNNPE
jgi:predicted glycoside hydrolase/deacetylase ChbG (UPF0249 family)